MWFVIAIRTAQGKKNHPPRNGDHTTKTANNAQTRLSEYKSSEKELEDMEAEVLENPISPLLGRGAKGGA